MTDLLLLSEWLCVCMVAGIYSVVKLSCNLLNFYGLLSSLFFKECLENVYVCVCLCMGVGFILCVYGFICVGIYRAVSLAI